MRLEPPDAVVQIARKLGESGHEAWAVGGAVRDALAGRAGEDWDLATDARPERVRRLFRRTVPIGVEHGTVGVLGRDGVLYEVTTFRRDVETFGRHAVVEFSTSLQEDLARRDFTINAIAWNPLTGEVRDPFGGLDDLRGGVLRTVGDAAARFAEDYLRVLRALRFAGHFGLAISADTWRALREAVYRLDVLSAERVRDELNKVLGKTAAASTTLRLYAESSALSQLIPELAATIEIPVEDGLDAWTLALRATDAVAPARVQLRWAALLHTIGYPAARTRDLRGGWRYTGHERFGGDRAAQVLRRLRSSNAEVERISRLVGLQSDLFPPDAPDAGVRRWLAHVTPGYVHDLFRLRIAMWRASPSPRGDADLKERWQHVRRVRRDRPVLTLEGLALGGNDLRALGLQPGPRFREILHDLLGRVLEQPELNRRDELLAIVQREHIGS